MMEGQENRGTDGPPLEIENCAEQMQGRRNVWDFGDAYGWSSEHEIFLDR